MKFNALVPPRTLPLGHGNDLPPSPGWGTVANCQSYSDPRVSPNRPGTVIRGSSYAGTPASRDANGDIGGFGQAGSHHETGCSAANYDVGEVVFEERLHIFSSRVSVHSGPDFLTLSYWGVQGTRLVVLSVPVKQSIMCQMDEILTKALQKGK